MRSRWRKGPGRASRTCGAAGKAGRLCPGVLFSAHVLPVLAFVLLLCTAFPALAGDFRVEQEVTGTLMAGEPVVWTMAPVGAAGPCRVILSASMVYDNGSAEVLDAVGMRVEEGGTASIRLLPPHEGTLCLDAEWTDGEGERFSLRGEYPVTGQGEEVWPEITVDGRDAVTAGEEASFVLTPSLGTPPYTVRWDAFLAGGEEVASGIVASGGEAVHAVVVCPQSGEMEMEVRVTDAAGLKAYRTVRCTVSEPALRLEAAKTDLAVGETVRLAVTEAGRTRTYFSSDSDVVRVDDRGNATAAGVGTAVVTVKDGEAEGRLSLTVHPAAERLEAEPLILAPGETGRLRAQLLPSGARGTLRYLSADETVARVDAQGLVTAVGVGTAAVAVMDLDDPLLTVFTTVTVLSDTDERASAYVYGLRYEDQTISAVYGAVGGACTYTLSLTQNGRVISVRQREEAGIIRFYLADPADGNYVVTATAEDENGVLSSASASGCLDKAALTVSGESRMPVLVTGIELTGPETAYLGEEARYSARVIPSDAEGAILWESADPGIARVDETGTVTVLAAGWTRITAAAADGSGVRASVDVECVDDSLSLGTEEIRIFFGESMIPEPVSRQGRVYAYRYASSDESVVRAEGGTLFALKEGKCVLTVSAEGTPLRLSVPVTVLPCRHADGTWQVEREPGCVSPGKRVFICSVCGQTAREEEIPAAGHDRGRWETRVPATPTAWGERVRRCTVCGEILQSDGIRPISETRMNMNTACSEGITFRSLFPVDEWYMFTPIDLTADGVQVLKLIASNMYQIGTVYLTVEDGTLTADYEFVNPALEFTDEFITFLPSLESFRGTDDLSLYRNFGFGIPWDIAGDLGCGDRALLFMCCRLNYSRDWSGLVVFYESQPRHLAYLEQLTRMLR